MAKKAKEQGYGALALARHLLYERGEVTRMGEDGRIPSDTADDVGNCLDRALEAIFRQWLDYKAKKRNYPCLREKWDRTKWEKKLIVGMADKKYHERYLLRAGLQPGSIWDEPNFGDSDG